MAFYSIETGAKAVQEGEDVRDKQPSVIIQGKNNRGKQEARDRWAKQHPELARRKAESQRRAADKKNHVNVAFDVSKQAPGTDGLKNGDKNNLTGAACHSIRFTTKRRGQEAYEKK